MSKPARKDAKALERLGLGTAQLMETIVNRNGELSREEESVFWESFHVENPLYGPEPSNEKAANIYVNKLLELIMSILDETKQIRFPLQSIINSLALAQFCLPMKIDAVLEKTIRKWTANKVKYSIISPSADELMRVMAKRFLDKDDAIETLVVQCTTLKTLEEFNALNDDMVYTTQVEDDNKNAGEKSFVYGYLKNLVSLDKSKQFPLIEAILMKMRTLTQQLKISQKMSESVLMASFHIIRQLLAVDPLTDAAFICNSFAILEPFYLWPRPLGTQAHLMLDAWRHELVAPGHNMRVKLLEESRMLMFEYKQTKAYPIFYLFDASDHVSAGWSFQMGLEMWEDMFKHNNEDIRSFDGFLAKNPRGLPVPIMANLLLNMFASDKLLKSNTVDTVRSLNSGAIATFFSMAYQGMLNTVQQKVDTAAAIRLNMLTVLRDEMEAAVHNPLYFSSPSDWYDPEANPADYALFAASEKFVPTPLPSMHIGIPEGTAFNMPDQSLIEKLGHTAFPHTPLYDHLVDLFEIHTTGATELSTSQIIIAVCGGSHVLHALICAYLGLCANRPELCKLVEPKFLILPFVSNPIANYIARHDAWYNRHILTPFRSEIFLLPRTQPIFPARFNSDRLYVNAPGLFHRSLVEQYARETENVLNVTVFKIAAWYESPSASQSKKYIALADHMIPVLQRMEIGFTVAAPNKIAPSLRIQYSRVDMKGQQVGVIFEENLTYQHVILSHVPIQRDLALPANPAASFLEMYAYLTEAAKGKSKLRETRAHVNQMEITNSDPLQLFNIVVDGNQFGPYYKVVISPHIDNGSIVKFPISTFFPLPESF